MKKINLLQMHTDVLLDGYSSKLNKCQRALEHVEGLLKNNPHTLSSDYETLSRYVSFVDKALIALNQVIKSYKVMVMTDDKLDKFLSIIEGNFQDELNSVHDLVCRYLVKLDLNPTDFC
ncbi:MAG: hypothetical protein ACI9TY_000028 [Alphaproteobacteria bacterium]|jgi:hypothetical protein